MGPTIRKTVELRPVNSMIYASAATSNDNLPNLSRLRNLFTLILFVFQIIVSSEKFKICDGLDLCTN